MESEIYGGKRLRLKKGEGEQIMIGVETEEKWSRRRLTDIFQMKYLLYRSQILRRDSVSKYIQLSPLVFFFTTLAFHLEADG